MRSILRPVSRVSSSTGAMPRSSSRPGSTDAPGCHTPAVRSLRPGPGAAAARLRTFPPLLPLGARDQRRWHLRQYELMVIVDPAADEEKVGTVVDRVTKILTDRGGEVSGVDRWGRRKLAFEIDRKSEGYYLVLRMNADPEILAELDRVLSVADEVLRFKVVRTAA
ncbi:MAG TPA: 30S ribosomal protein S6 [Actinomycetota bacterium]|nr:30S ribosomal protein S6 [Actinomycetota bacterium]